MFEFFVKAIMSDNLFVVSIDFDRPCHVDMILFFPFQVDAAILYPGVQLTLLRIRARYSSAIIVDCF